MTKTILIAAGLALSTDAAAQDFSPTPGIDLLEETTALHLRPTAEPDRSKFSMFNWDSDAPFWVALGTAILTSTVILVGIHASNESRGWNSPPPMT